MMGMDQVIAKMIGLTPDEMKGIITNAQERIAETHSRVTVIETKLDEIIVILKGLGNERYNDSIGDGRV